MKLPVFVPKLPTVDELLPYLREIEAAKYYSNFGPMVSRLQSELAKYFGVQVDQVVTLSNATLALEGAVATSSSKETRWLSPSWTYAATNLALERCKVEFEFGDVDQDWRLIPKDSCSAIMDVCSFGDNLKLNRFINPHQTILVDAAASFPALKNSGKLLNEHAGPIGVVVSFHPTKVLPGVEGGVFISNRPSWVEQIKIWSRFGMQKESRVSEHVGTNAKMSEYQAAVILASIKSYERLESDWVHIHNCAKEISTSLGLNTHPAMNRKMLSSYWIIESEPESIRELEEAALTSGFQTRRWWEYGCHQMPAFSNRNKFPLPKTERIAETTLGLPFHLFMGSQEFDIIHSALALAKRKF